MTPSTISPSSTLATLIGAPALCLLAASGCIELDATAADDAVSLTFATQAATLAPPQQDPQLCKLPAGRYIVTATPTTRPAVYDVRFAGDDVPGSKPSSLCKTMQFIWNEATGPVPPIPPPDNQFDMYAFEGWFVPLQPGGSHFSVKAVWTPGGAQGVVTQVSGLAAFGYAILGCEFGVPCNSRLNWIGSGSDANHSFPLDSSISLPGQALNPEFDKNGTIVLTGPNLDAAKHLVPTQTLYLKSGTARVLGAGVIATRPCVAGLFCPPAAP